MNLNYAICSEVYQGWKLADICKSAKLMGYDGLEIAHFHFFEDVRDVPASQRAEMRRAIEGEGMVCSGLHWLMVSPKGLHITTRDAELRQKSWDYLAHLVDFCGDMGGPVMILGSPHQRKTLGEMTIDEAHHRLAEGLAKLAPKAAERDVVLLMEAVPSSEGNVCNRLADAVDIVRKVDHPHVKTMFDTHNTADETESFEILLGKYWNLIRHIHVNEMNGHYPGSADLDFAPLIRHLVNARYSGWVSLEVFNFDAGSENIARNSIGYLKAIESRIRSDEL